MKLTNSIISKFFIPFQNLKTIYSNEYNIKYPLFAFIRYFFYLLFKILKFKKVRLNIWSGKRVFWYSNSIQGTWLFFNYLIDYNEFIFLKRFIKNESVFLDVGANVGYYSVWVSKFIEEGKILAFEPNSLNFERLIDNISEIKCITPYNFAISNYNGTISFTKNVDALNHIVKKGGDRDDIEVVNCYTIDKVANDNSITIIDFIKIDVEGFEIDVLMGCENLLLNKSILLIQLEIEEENALGNSSYSVKEILDVITKHNYFLCAYDRKSNKLFQTEYQSEIDNYYATFNLDLINNRLIYN